MTEVTLSSLIAVGGSRRWVGRQPSLTEQTDISPHTHSRLLGREWKCELFKRNTSWNLEKKKHFFKCLYFLIVNSLKATFWNLNYSKSYWGKYATQGYNGGFTVVYAIHPLNFLKKLCIPPCFSNKTSIDADVTSISAIKPNFKV